MKKLAYHTALKLTAEQFGKQIFKPTNDKRTVCLILIFVVWSGRGSNLLIGIVLYDGTEIGAKHIDIEFLLH